MTRAHWDDLVNQVTLVTLIILVTQDTLVTQPLQNEFPEFWEFLGIPSYSKTCK